jgi:hypothetical protein
LRPSFLYFINREIDDLFDEPNDSHALKMVSHIFDQCTHKEDKTNPCLEGSYSSKEKAIRDFIDKKSDSLIGYSEILFDILSHVPESNVHISLLSNNAQGTPRFFTDVFVKRSGCLSSCSETALKFVDFMTHLDTYNHLVFGRNEGIPKYILPADMRFFESSIAKNNQYYIKFYKTLKESFSLPNDLSMHKKRLQQAVLKSLLAEKAEN